VSEREAAGGREAAALGLFSYRVRSRLVRWFPRLGDRLLGRRSVPGTGTNVTMAAIPIDPVRYGDTNELSFVLKPSKVSGVGVFCTHGIEKGTRLALFPDLKPRYFSNEELARDPRLEAFCRVYGVETGRGSFVARSFGHMQIGWYLNHSDEPNARHERFEYFAIRDIEANEEITIGYHELYPRGPALPSARDGGSARSAAKPDAQSTGKSAGSRSISKRVATSSPFSPARYGL
jgi:hypothetical protein